MPEPQFLDRTSRLNLPLLFAGQSQRETFVNETFIRLDALVHCAIESQADTPPAAPQEGQCWLVAPSASGAWAGQGSNIASYQQGQWLFQPPRDGLHLLNKSTGQRLHYHGSWQAAVKPALPTGGTVVDTQARAAIDAIVNVLIVSGVLAAQ